MMTKLSICSNEKGVIFTTALMFMTIIALLGSTAVVVTTTDIKIGSNFKDSRQAFYDADAGVRYAIARIEDDLKSGNISLPSTVGDSVSLSCVAPYGFSFTLSSLRMTGSNRYTFISTGIGLRNSQAKIEATFKRSSALGYAVFGDQKVETKNSANIYSYNHDTTANPTPADSTGEADMGSNGHIEIKDNAYIDGDVARGEDLAGNTATIEKKTGAIVTGSEVLVDRIDPDPLGAVGGEYAAKFTNYRASNDNNLASPAIIGTEIDLGNGDTMTLYGKAGGANYYITKMELGNGATLNIDTSSGPVNIFLHGKLEAKNGAIINLNGAPKEFRVYSDHTDSIEFKNSSAFRGLIYAPYAKVEIKNSADVYGAIWSKETEIKNSGDIYFDTSVKDVLLSNNLALVAWKDVRS
ncbi:MAG: pilus assembly PilX N-terminal domain-containing protein [Deltaproteobacteria bacterium]|nr:pilus assembly PilX N-terminal domain-containing protein [Deltaproteobacteria bacterium]